MKLNKLLTVFALLIITLIAQDRPKIALVLSGGGAHVEGLYASGKTPQEIEEMLTTTNWTKHIKTDFDRQDTPMRKKDIDYTYQGRLGIGVNADNEVVLPTGVLKRQLMLLKFMELTQNVQNINDIENGNAVVLKSGSLAKAIYASSSIPRGFQPINIDGVDLVDSGVSDNTPIQVARDMGADIIIAVDVSENFNEDLDVNSYFVVMGQLVNILMRKNANESISTLTDKDILLTPDLNGFGGLDADKYPEIIQKGVEDVTAQNEDRLKVLSISDEEYAKYKLKHRYKHKTNEPIIDEIKIVNPTYLSNDSIRKRIHQQIGSKLDEKMLRVDLLHLYHMMIFDSVEYELVEVDGRNILLIETTPSWDNHSEVRFSLGLEDDFNGHSAYSLKVGYIMFGLNKLGGEWKSDFEIGRYEKAYTELFQPLDSMQRYYVKPSIVYESVTDIFERGYGNQELFSSRAGGSFAVGAHVTTDYELEVGASLFKDKVKIYAEDKSYKYDAKPIYALIKVDNLDNVNFSKVGVKAELR